MLAERDSPFVCRSIEPKSKRRELRDHGGTAAVPGPEAQPGYRVLLALWCGRHPAPAALRPGRLHRPSTVAALSSLRIPPGRAGRNVRPRDGVLLHDRGSGLHPRTRAVLRRPDRDRRAGRRPDRRALAWLRSEEHTSELQSHLNLVCRLLLEKKKRKSIQRI